MVEILKYNDDDLKDTEIDQVITKVRAFILSSKNNMLIGRDDECYKLIEASVGETESLEDALKKVFYNEMGIVLDAKDEIDPFYEIRYYNKDYKGSGINRLSDTIYYLVKTDKLPNYKKLKLTDEEIIKKLPIEVIRKGLFAKTLKEYIEEEKNPVSQIKAKEILLAFDKLKSHYNL